MKEFLESFFQNLGLTLESLEVRLEGEDLYVTVKTPDSSLLIGQHGKNIDAFKHLISRFAEKKLEKFIHVHLEVNDYMKAKDERFFHFLESKISFAMSTGKSIRIPNLSAFERKKAHNYISEKKIEGLVTKSEGEGAERALTLSYSGTLVASTVSHTPRSSPKRDDTAKDLEDLSLDGVGI